MTKARSRSKATFGAMAALAVLSLASAHAGWQDRPGEFDYYALVLSWSPTYCDNHGREEHRRQCQTEADRSFILHGLWPQYHQGWPEYCHVPERPWVPYSVIDQMRDIMPSKNLVIHEYRAHGTCSGMDPTQFFQTARDLYQRIKIPDRYSGKDQNLFVSAPDIERDFAEANPWLKPEMMAVSCRHHELLDVRFCFGKDLQPTACGGNEDQQRLCNLDRIDVPPAEEQH